MIWIWEAFWLRDKSRIIGSYFIGDYSVEGHEDSVAVERKEGRG